MMYKSITIAIVISFTVGIITGCAIASDEVVASTEDARFKVVAGPAGEGIGSIGGSYCWFLKYDTVTGESWAWSPGWKSLPGTAPGPKHEWTWVKLHEPTILNKTPLN